MGWYVLHHAAIIPAILIVFDQARLKALGHIVSIPLQMNALASRFRLLFHLLLRLRCPWQRLRLGWRSFRKTASTLIATQQRRTLSSCGVGVVRVHPLRLRPVADTTFS